MPCFCTSPRIVEYFFCAATCIYGAGNQRIQCLRNGVIDVK